MDRRYFALAISAGLVAGCDTNQKPAATATLLNNGEIQEAMKRLSDSIDNMVGDVGEFDDENWREVVPKVVDSAQEVSSAFELLRRALSVSNS
jgi:CMP-N-acetylneuraminic acid synthetase